MVKSSYSIENLDHFPKLIESPKITTRRERRKEERATKVKYRNKSLNTRP